MKKKYLIAVLIIFLLSFAYLAIKNTGKNSESNISDNNISNDATEGNWRDIEIKDILTGDKIKISDFKGKSVLLESFAVWCPTCLRQQKEIKKLKDEIGEDVIHVSLDIDLNEDESEVREHANINNLDWIFAISPIELTRGLIDDFGNTVINAPAAPVVLICEDQSTRLLKNGVKSSSELKTEIEKGC